MANLTYIYAGLMFMLGLLGFLSNPAKAKSALVVGIVVAVIFVLLGYFIKKGKRGAMTLLSVLGALLAMMLVWRTSNAWMAYLAGEEGKLVAALLTSCMLLITLVITGLSVTLRKYLRK